ncbi:MAG TPA: YrhC family protein [Bacillales bacterium]|nr:YrhC family protein [Bacillales bacterium]
MDEKNRAALKHKVVDYKNYSMVLLFMSAFLSIGSIIPFTGKTVVDQIVLMWTGVAFILMSVFFFKRMKKIRKQLED